MQFVFDQHWLFSLNVPRAGIPTLRLPSTLGDRCASAIRKFLLEIRGTQGYGTWLRAH
jgi:hypothetical protein